MAGLVSSPKAPTIQAPPVVTPQQVDPAVAAAARAQAAQEAQAAGRSSTIATSGQGVTAPPVIGRKTLLGQ